LKNSIKTLLLSLLLGSNWQNYGQNAQPDSLTQKATDINPVMVIANRQLGLRSDAPMAVYQISNKTITETRPNLLTELLNKVPGVVMANFNHEQHTVAIRQPIGLNPYFLYLEDGIPIRPVGVFQNNGLIELNMAAINNIEVVKGPSSSIYGPEAAGGAINFNSIAPTAHKTAQIGLQHDSYGYWQARASSSFMLKPTWGIAAAAFYAKQKNSWQAASDYHKLSFSIRTDVQLNHTTKLIGHITSNQYQAQAGGSVDSLTFVKRNYISQAAFAYRNINASRARLTLQKQWNTHNSSSIHIIARNNSIAQLPAYSIRRVTGKPSIANGEKNENNFKSIGFIWQNNHNFSAKSSLITGISTDYAPNTYWAYYLLLNRDPATGINTINTERPDSMLVNYQAKILNTAAYAQWSYRVSNKLKINAGLRYDLMRYNFDNYLKPSAFAGAADERNAFNKITPKLGLTYQHSGNLGFYGNAAQGFSPPNISQLYRGVKVPELQAAIFNNTEVGAWGAVLHQKLLFDIALYYMPSKGEVVRYVNADNSVENKSSGSAIHKGIEYSLTYKINKQISLSLNGSHARHIYKNFRLSASQIYDNKEMPQSPHFTGFAELMYKPTWFAGLRLSAEWQRVGPFFKDNDNLYLYNDPTFLGLPGLSVLHIRAAKSWPKLEIYANILNASNELYTTYVSRSNFGNNFYPTAPRNLTLGVNWKFFQGAISQ
jgi:iron complex outermembrane recepter protein